MTRKTINPLALHAAVRAQNYRKATQLLEAGADPNSREPGENHAPLHISAILGDHKTTKLLLDHGANPDQPDARSWTALHHAADTSLVRIQRMNLQKALASMEQKLNRPLTQTDIREALASHVPMLGTEASPELERRLRLIAQEPQRRPSLKQRIADTLETARLALAEKKLLLDSHKTIQALLQHGANPRKTNDRGQTPVQLTENQGIKRLLNQAARRR